MIKNATYYLEDLTRLVEVSKKELLEWESEEPYYQPIKYLIQKKNEMLGIDLNATQISKAAHDVGDIIISKASSSTEASIESEKTTSEPIEESLPQSKIDVEQEVQSKEYGDVVAGASDTSSVEADTTVRNQDSTDSGQELTESEHALEENVVTHIASLYIDDSEPVETTYENSLLENSNLKNVQDYQYPKIDLTMYESAISNVTDKSKKNDNDTQSSVSMPATVADQPTKMKSKGGAKTKSKKADAKSSDKKGKKKEKEIKRKKIKLKKKKDLVNKSKKSKEVDKDDTVVDKNSLDFLTWLRSKALKKQEEPKRAKKQKKKKKKKNREIEVIKEAEKSNYKDTTVVSETLARILASQGHKREAIDMYKQLSLLVTEKSSYFAAKIEELKNS